MRKNLAFKELKARENEQELFSFFDTRQGFYVQKEGEEVVLKVAEIDSEVNLSYFINTNNDAFISTNKSLFILRKDTTYVIKVESIDAKDNEIKFGNENTKIFISTDEDTFLC